MSSKKTKKAHLPSEIKHELKHIINTCDNVAEIPFSQVYQQLRVKFEEDRLTPVRKALKKKAKKWAIKRLETEENNNPSISSQKQAPREKKSKQEHQTTQSPTKQSPVSKGGARSTPKEKQKSTPKEKSTPEKEKEKSTPENKNISNSTSPKLTPQEKRAEELFREALDFMGEEGPRARRTSKNRAPKKATATMSKRTATSDLKEEMAKGSDSEIDDKNTNLKNNNNNNNNNNEKSQKKGSGWNSEVFLLPPLAAFLGIKKCPRHEVTKRLIAYVKEHNLQDPKDKRKILFDSELEAIFKRKTSTFFKIQSLITNHVCRDESEIAWGKD